MPEQNLNSNCGIWLDYLHFHSFLLLSSCSNVISSFFINNKNVHDEKVYSDFELFRSSSCNDRFNHKVSLMSRFPRRFRCVMLTNNNSNETYYFDVCKRVKLQPLIYVSFPGNSSEFPTFITIIADCQS